MLQVLDAGALRQWCAAGLEALTAARHEIDDLNVYPVPDGDTGTNLALTMTAVTEAVAAAAADLPATAAAMARGALMGARGNSGVILSQLLRGLAEVLAADEPAGGECLQRALIRAAELGYAAVATPVEGTLLTVAREAAAAAAELGPADLSAVVKAAAAGATAALARTPDQLPELKAAGVVDAGGRGLCVLLDALELVVRGAAAVPATGQLLVGRDRSTLAAAREEGSPEFGYEVQYLLRDANEAGIRSLTAALGALGDSLVVVGGEGLHNVHVHVNDVGAAIEAGVEVGTPFRITVTRFADQLAGEPAAWPAAPPSSAAAGDPASTSSEAGPPAVDVEPAPPAPGPDAADRPAGASGAEGGPGQPPTRSGRGVVAVAAGAGLGGLFVAAGATVVAGGPTASPSQAELLAAIVRSGCREVVLLPNDSTILTAATSAAARARDQGFTVAVVPTRSTVQGLAALAVADGSRPFADDVAAMADAAGSTRWAAVTTAVREAMTMAGVCRPGDVLGLIEGDVVLLGVDVEAVAGELLDRMLSGGGELVTVITGEPAPAGLAERLRDVVTRAHPVVETVVYEGGQPHYPVLLGVE